MRTACVMCNPLQCGLVGAGWLGSRLGLMILKVFSNCNDSVILFFYSLKDSMILFFPSLNDSAILFFSGHNDSMSLFSVW